MSLREWMSLRAPDFAALDPMAAIAVLPLAAVEQHGPHLPVGTDTIIGQGMLATVAGLCPGDPDLLVLPLQAVGKSNEHLWAKGTLTLSAGAALEAWLEIGLSVARAGVRKIILANSHGGNADLMSILARELRERAGMLAVRSSWSAFGLPEGMYTDRERAFGIHGGDMETSLMLHFRPDLVDMGAAQDFRSSAEGAAIPPTGAIGYGWIASDLNPAGVVGDAHLATPEKGRLTALHQAAGFLRLAENVRDHVMAGFAPASR